MSWLNFFHLFLCLICLTNGINVANYTSTVLTTLQTNSSSSTTSNLIRVHNLTELYKSKNNNNYLDEILQKLDAVKASKCEYGSNPKIAEICPDYTQTVAELFTRKHEFSDLRLHHIEHLIINKTIISQLKHKCLSGKWCLDNANSVDVPYNPIGSKLLKDHSLELCLFSSCFNKMKSYINHCVVSNVTASVLEIAPLLCELSNNGRSKQYCLEPSLRLIYSSIATHYDIITNKTIINSCEQDIKLKGVCQNECKSIALELSKLESCCPNSSLVKRFTLLNWYSDYSDKVEKSCHLPLTGLCWSEGKYYIGISPNAVIIAVAITIISTISTLLIIYVFCCRKHLKVQQPFTDSYEYSQLNQEVEEEMNMVNTYTEDEYGHITKKNRIDLDNNTDISRFVNQHQTDIKSLLLG